ncbi:aldehyde dehydrogenase family protein [Egicoccus halophilus]|uniref:Aldehyde dehydrogenase n=1 Tax=Egicoccus halophilus TaxID=1670830 RepID=A0A8J3AB74_9ACTN|nr:aldehyde dehydrogenase family protein [Egicoccus halophilus]GGI09301.1 aldehyde dehydrogenase [Egicoccus halophilus]
MSQTPVRIDGEAVTAEQGMQIRAPYDGQLLGEVPACTAEHVDRAVAAARRALREDRLPAWRRAEILDRAAELLADDEVADDLARTIALEAAKPITTARVEVTRAVSTFRFAAATCRTVSGEVLPLDASEAGEGRLGFGLRVPIGVVGAITPFNFPLNLVAHKLAPAIAAGCPVVLKPAHQTPLTGIKLAELLLARCGLPASWLHVVTGSGSEVGAELVEHPDVAMITFTGSPGVGWGIRQAAPRKKVSLELGNNSPVIVQPDADWAAAAKKIAAAGNTHAGQSCISAQRVFVHADVAADFVRTLVEAVEALVVGDPLDDTTQVSALIDQDARDRVTGWVDEAVEAGATVVTGGKVDDAGVLRPTVLTDVTGDMKVCAEEVFGPVLAVATYADVDDALQAANDTRYGLHAGIFTTDLALARRAIEELDFGGVVVNDVPTWRADQMPYGGSRDSGNTREGPLYSVLEMTEIRSAILS